jgi:hypothetical protein
MTILKFTSQYILFVYFFTGAKSMRSSANGANRKQRLEKEKSRIRYEWDGGKVRTLLSRFVNV